jgi:uncharacterized protein (DUF2384 family)
MSMKPLMRQKADLYQQVFSRPQKDILNFIKIGTPVAIDLAATSENLSRILNVSKGDANKIMGISASDKSRGKLANTETLDRVAVVLETRKRVEHFLGDRSEEWLKKPNKHLDGRSPLEAVQTRMGTKTLMDYLNSLEAGHYL